MPTGALAADTAALTAATTSVAGTLRAVQSGVSKKIDAPAAVIAALSAADARNFAAQLGLWYVIGASGVSASITGTTSETALATITIPAGAMGANGILRVTPMWSMTNSVNTKTMRVRLGGISGTVIKGVGRTTIALDSDQLTIWNRNSQSSQVAFNSGSLPSYGTSASAATTAAVDTSVARDLVLSGQLTNTGETITLESYVVEIKYGA